MEVKKINVTARASEHVICLGISYAMFLVVNTRGILVEKRDGMRSFGF